MATELSAASKIENLDAKIKALSQIISEKEFILIQEVSNAYELRADAWREKKVFQKAAADYSSALKLHESVTLLYSRASVYAEMKDYGRAAADLRRIIEISPQVKLIPNYRAKIAELQARAEEQWRKAHPKVIPAFIAQGMEVRESVFRIKGCQRVIVKDGKYFCIRKNQTYPLRCPRGSWAKDNFPGCMNCGKAYPVKRKNGKITCLD